MRGFRGLGLLVLLLAAAGCAQGGTSGISGEGETGGVRLRFHGMLESEVKEVRLVLTAKALPAVSDIRTLSRQPGGSFDQEVSGIPVGTYDLVAQAYDENEKLGFWSETIELTVSTTPKTLDLFLFQELTEPSVDTPYFVAVQFAEGPVYEQPVDIQVWGGGGVGPLSLDGAGDGTFDSDPSADASDTNGATLEWTPAAAVDPPVKQDIELILDDGQGNTARMFLSVDVDYQKGSLDFVVLFNHAPSLVLVTDVRQIGATGLEVQIDATYGDPDARPGDVDPYNVNVVWDIDDCDDKGLVYTGAQGALVETVDVRNPVQRTFGFEKQDASTGATCKITVELSDSPTEDPASTREATINLVLEAINPDIPNCPQGETSCGGVCVDTSEDMNHCGGCGVVCEGYDCKEGACQGVTTLPRTLGHNFSLALHIDGNVYTWGGSVNERLGRDFDPPAAELPAPIAGPFPGDPIEVLDLASGNGHTCAVLTSKNVACWGKGSRGQLGTGGASDSKTPVLVERAINTVLENLASVVTAGETSCAISQDGTVWCWGNNSRGQVGSGAAVSPVYRAAEILSDVVDLTGGETHFCALKSDDTVWCWGENSSGQLGNGQTDQTNRIPLEATELTAFLSGKPFKPVQLAAGENFTCARMDDGTVYCWGENNYGQLGDGNGSTSSLTPVQVGNLGTAVRIHARRHHACAELVSGGAKCWGRNTFGQLGNGQTGEANWKDTPGDVLEAEDEPLMGIEELSLGTNHGCAKLVDTSMVCWGQNAAGQLGDGSTTNRPWPMDVQF